MKLTRSLALLTLAALTGCGSTGSPTSSGEAPVAARGESDVANNVTVPLKAGWTAVGFECQQVTALSAPGAAGMASFTGTAYQIENFNQDNVNAAPARARRGFWVFANAATNVTYSGVDDGQGHFVDLSLNGWQLVSFNTATDVPGANVTASRNGQSVSLSSVVLPTFFQVNPDNTQTPVDVSAGGILRPSRAYWVFCNSPTVRLSLAGGPSASPASSPTPSPVASATPSPSPTPAHIVVGTDAGVPNQVAVFSPTGTRFHDFQPFAPAFNGGVRVAQGDVNGDGRLEIICGAGPDGAPTVATFDLLTGRAVSSFTAFDPGFRGGVYVAAGDVDGDGTADIIAGAGTGSRVTVFSGATNKPLANFFAFDASFAGGVRVAAGDVNGDGRADIICGQGPGGSVVSIFDGQTARLIDSFTVDTGTPPAGVYVTYGDVVGDATPDIVVSADAGAPPTISIYNARTRAMVTSFFGFAPTFRGGVRVAVGDFDSDGKAEIIAGGGGAGAGGAAPAQVTVFTGSGTVLSSFNAFPAGGGVLVGDKQ